MSLERLLNALYSMCNSNPYRVYLPPWQRLFRVRSMTWKCVLEQNLATFLILLMHGLLVWYMHLSCHTCVNKKQLTFRWPSRSFESHWKVIWRSFSPNLTSVWYFRFYIHMLLPFRKTSFNIDQRNYKIANVALYLVILHINVLVNVPQKRVFLKTLLRSWSKAWVS